MTLSRRTFVTLAALTPLLSPASAAYAQTRDIWTAQQAHRALLSDEARLLDIRSREEWRDTGVAREAWPVSMHEERFAERLFAARDLAGGRTVALICAVGGRSRAVMQAIRQAGYTGFADIPEGMLGSSAGPGWIASGLPVVPADEALGGLPRSLL